MFAVLCIHQYSINNWSVEPVSMVLPMTDRGNHDHAHGEADRLESCEPERHQSTPSLMSRGISESAGCDDAGDVSDGLFTPSRQQISVYRWWTDHDYGSGITVMTRNVSTSHKREDLEHIRRDVEQGRLEDGEAEAGNNDRGEVGDNSVRDLSSDTGDEKDVQSGSDQVHQMINPNKKAFEVRTLGLGMPPEPALA